MVKQSVEVEVEAFEEFSSSLFRLTRSLRSTSHLWVQLPGNLKRTDLSILMVLRDNGDCRPGFVADVLNVGASVVSRQLVSLVANGLVFRRKDPMDGRAELISLSAEGRARLTTLRQAYVSGMREQFTDWDASKVIQAAALLDEISDHILPALGGSSRAPREHASTHTPTKDTKDLHVC
ncbi:MAG: MarR family winged helix-turn-helix transcriptional regulator [Knoellia sp.]